MTTADNPSNAGGGENLATGIRKRREEELATKELLEKMAKYSESVGALSLSMVGMEKEFTHQCGRADMARQEDLRQLKELEKLVERSLKDLVDRVMGYPVQVEMQLSRLREESKVREMALQRLYQFLLGATVVVCLIGGFLGWQVHENLMGPKESDQRTEAIRTERALLGEYLQSEQPDILKKQWPRYQDWLVKNGVQSKSGRK